MMSIIFFGRMRKDKDDYFVISNEAKKKKKKRKKKTKIIGAGKGMGSIATKPIKPRQWKAGAPLM